MLGLKVTLLIIFIGIVEFGAWLMLCWMEKKFNLEVDKVCKRCL